MPAYKKNSDKNRMLSFELPSTPEARIHVPNRLGYEARMKIRSASYKVHVEIDEHGQEKVFQVFDPGAAEREVLVQSLLDSRTYSNLTDEKDKEITFTRFWINNDMDENDALWLGQVLMNELGGDLGFELEDSSAEGEEEEPPKKKNTTKGKPSLEPTPEDSQ